MRLLYGEVRHPSPPLASPVGPRLIQMMKRCRFVYLFIKMRWKQSSNSASLSEKHRQTIPSLKPEHSNFFVHKTPPAINIEVCISHSDSLSLTHTALSLTSLQSSLSSLKIMFKRSVRCGDRLPLSIFG
jgi:hypothetical protein